METGLDSGYCGLVTSRDELVVEVGVDNNPVSVDHVGVSIIIIII